LPRVSVVMPVYNAERYVGEAIASILGQTYRDFELIVVDDGSTDRSAEIIDRCAAGDSRVRVLRRPNTGIIGALNDGLALAQGELVARMDHDDRSLPERFAQQVEYLDAHPACVAVGTGVLLVDEDGDPIAPLVLQQAHEAIEAQLLRGRGLSVAQPSSMIRRGVLVQVGGYRVFPCEDLDLFLRLAERGRLANLPQTLLHYRKHAASATATQRRHEADATRREIVEQALARRGQAGPATLRRFAEPESKEDQYRHWAVTATSAGNHRTANKYLRKLIASNPWGGHTWRSVGVIYAQRLVGLLPGPLAGRIRAARQARRKRS